MSTEQNTECLDDSYAKKKMVSQNMLIIYTSSWHH